MRAVCLRALTDTPDAFATTIAEAEAQPPQLWQERLAKAEAATKETCFLIDAYLGILKTSEELLTRSQ